MPEKDSARKTERPFVVDDIDQQHDQGHRHERVELVLLERRGVVHERLHHREEEQGDHHRSTPENSPPGRIEQEERRDRRGEGKKPEREFAVSDGADHRSLGEEEAGVDTPVALACQVELDPVLLGDHDAITAPRYRAPVRSPDAA